MDLARISNHTHRWAERVGLPPPRLSAAATPGTVILLPDHSPAIRLGVNLWNQGDENALRGCIALSLARHALGGSRVRALAPAALDLLLAAAFEAVNVFNPMTADPDPRRLKDLAGHLNKLLQPRLRRVLERQCQSLANHAFDNTARATTSTDLTVAALITGDVRAVISAACLLEGASGGSLKQRVNRSPLAQILLSRLLSDDFLSAQRAVTR
jgi:hypothetical protein